jgi:hypothetical protein
MIDALGEVEACRGCAKGHPLPAGRWQGGHCCGGRTLHIWSADEVAALRLGGTRFADLDPPRSDHAGCIYRGPLGCSLAPQDRPTICVRFLCLELRGELREDPRWREVSRLGAELRDTFAALMELLGREPRTKGPVAADGAPLSALLPRHVSPR